MASNLDIDPALIKLALRISGERSAKAVITRALEEFIAQHNQKGLLDLMGTLGWQQCYEDKAGRTRK